MSLFDIKDQVVVITGGTGVLGRAIGSHLAREGAKVVLLGRRKDVGEELAEDIRKQGGHATFMVCDVTDIEAVNQVRDEVVRLYGRVDALLNAAGGNMPGATIPPGKTLFDVQVEEFQRVLNVNLTGTLIPTQAFLKPMTEAGHGSIVNFSSMAAFRPLSRVMGYQQPHSLPGQRGSQQVQPLHTCQRHCPRILPHRPEPLAAHHTRR